MNLPQINADDRRYKQSDMTAEVIGISYEVYNDLGFGFLESLNEEAMAIVLKSKGIEFQQQVRVLVWFRDQKIGFYEADLVVGGVVLVGVAK